MKKAKELKAASIQPDDIQFRHQLKLSEGKADISIVNSSNGYSKITTFSLKSLKKIDKDLEEIKESEEEAMKDEQNITVVLNGLSTSVICRNSRGVRKEIALLYLEHIHFFSSSTKETRRF